jgi:hypothetical protein
LCSNCISNLREARKMVFNEDGIYG